MRKTAPNHWTHLLLIVTYIVLHAMPALGAVVYVDPDATGGLNDGSSWENAFLDLQDGIAAAVADDEIWVAEGTYVPTDTGDRSISFALRNDVALYGGFAAIEDVREERDWEANLTYLSGDLDGDDQPGFVNNDENSYHVVTATAAETDTAVLDGFLVTAGNADGTDSEEDGGGMVNSGGSPTLANCTFVENHADDDAGGMVNYSSSIRLTNCTFTGNECVGRGGGMTNHDSSPVLVECVFEDNTAGDSFSSEGGGMYCKNSSPTMVDCVFRANYALWRGGGLYIERETYPAVIRCTFIDNESLSGGGVMIEGDDGNPEAWLINCKFYNNYGALAGGGVHHHHSAYSDIVTTTVNCVFSGNRSQRGGAVENGSATDLINCTLSANIGEGDSGRGGALFNHNAHAHTNLKNCILWGNTAASDAQIAVDGGTVAVEDSCVEGGWPGGVNILDQDPLFVDADGADDVVGTEDDDVQLQEGSPCIDIGNNAALPPDLFDLDDDGDVTEAIPYDVSGKKDRVKEDVVDLGAHEFGCGGVVINPGGTGLNQSAGDIGMLILLGAALISAGRRANRR